MTRLSRSVETATGPVILTEEDASIVAVTWARDSRQTATAKLLVEAVHNAPADTLRTSWFARAHAGFRRIGRVATSGHRAVRLSLRQAVLRPAARFLP